MAATIRGAVAVTPVWAGVIPVHVRYRAPVQAPDLRAGIPGEQTRGARAACIKGDP